MKFAIVIEGKQNAGKTSTIREFVGEYTDRKLKQMKKGWQRVFLNHSFRPLELWLHCIPSSPSETGITISDLLGGVLPEILIVAEQPDGVNYVATYDFLVKNDYKIVSLRIFDSHGTGVWERYKSSDAKRKLEARSKRIINELRKHVISYGLA